MNRFLERHQNKLVTGIILLGVVALIWLDDHRHSHVPELPAGQAVPAVSFKMLDGDKTITLASLRGEPTVLDFWATWCHPCMQSLPHIDALAKRYSGRVHFIAVNSGGEDPALQLETRSKLNLSMPIASDGSEAASLYKVDVLPTTVILDRNGKVVESFEGSTSEANIEHTLAKLL